MSELPQAPKLEKLSPEEEIGGLKVVHEFLQEFEVKAKYAHVWSQVLDNIAKITNSLISKDQEAKLQGLKKESLEKQSAKEAKKADKKKPEES